MDGRDGPQPRLTEEQVRADLQRQPHLLTQLAENALLVADSLRDNYFKNTARFVTALRKEVDKGRRGDRPDPPLIVHDVGQGDWSAVQGEVVIFIDGGFGQARVRQIAGGLTRSSRPGRRFLSRAVVD